MASAIAPLPVPRSSTDTVAVGGKARKRELDQRFRLGARYQYGRRHRDTQSPEFAHAGQVGDGLAVASTLREREERVGGFARQRVGAMRGQPRTIAVQHVREEHLRVERNEAAARERAGDRGWLA